MDYVIKNIHIDEQELKRKVPFNTKQVVENTK